MAERHSHMDRKQLKVENENHYTISKGLTWPGMDGGGGQK